MDSINSLQLIISDHLLNNMALLINSNQFIQAADLYYFIYHIEDEPQEIDLLFSAIRK